MHLSLRPLLLATGALLLSAQHAAAQFVELVTEAPVTFQVSLSTSTTTNTATGRATTTAVTKLTQAQVLEELRTAGIISDTSTTNWSIVAVRNAPADLELVNAAFDLYAVNKVTNARVRVPTSKFSAAAFGSVYRYTERHQGQYVLSSSGSVSSHVIYNYRPAFSTATGAYVIESTEAAGFAKVNFIAKDASDGFESFFYAISSLSAATRGGFNAKLNGSTDVTGLVTLTISVGAAKLVPASLYPDVEPAPFSDL